VLFRPRGTAEDVAPASIASGEAKAGRTGFDTMEPIKEEGTQVLNMLKGMGRGALGLAQFGAQVGMNPFGAGQDAANASVANIQKAGAAAGQGEILQALANMGGAVPVAGPGMLDLGERTAQTGDVAGAMGELAAAPLILKGLSVAGVAVPPALAKLRGMTISPLELIRMSAKLPGRAGKLGRIVVGGESLLSKLEKLGAPEQMEVIRGLPKPEYDLVMAQIEATKMNDRFDAKAQAARDAAALEQARLDKAQTLAQIAREEAAAKLAERDTIAAAKTEASILEKSDATKAQLEKQRETASIQSAKAEVKILEDAQKAEAAAQSELQAANAAVEKAGAREMAQALKAQSAAAEKATKAAEATLKAQERADKAQISREFRQRRQLDEQAKREAAKAAKGTPAPATPAEPSVPVAQPDVLASLNAGKPVPKPDPKTLGGELKAALDESAPKPQLDAPEDVAKFTRAVQGILHSVPRAKNGSRPTYGVADLEAAPALQKGHAGVSPEMKAKIIQTTVRVGAAAERVANGLANQGMTVREIVSHLKDTQGMPTNAALDFAEPAINALGDRMTPGQRASVKAIANRNNKKLKLEDLSD